MNAILTFQGFTEDHDRRTSTEDLYFTVIRTFLGPFTVGCLPQPWTADVRAIVRQLARQGIKRLALISYSHGQAAAVDAAKEAYKVGIAVELWCACDPVLRADWLPRRNAFQVFSFRSLFQKGTIKAPPNIRRIIGVRQRVNRPNGHDIVPTGPRQVVQHFRELPYPHSEIDGSPEWFALVELELSKFLGK